MTDEDLRARMRRTDPAASLPPLTPGDTERLTRTTMTTGQPTIAPSTGRRLLPLTAAAAVIVLLVAGLGWLILRPDRPAGPTASTPIAPAASETAPGDNRTASVQPGKGSPAKGNPGPVPILILKAPAAAAKCAEPTAARLAEAADYAFAGTVTYLTADTAALHVNHIYRGGLAGVVEVDQTGQTSEQMLGSGRFELDRRYLIASSAGTLLICGYSGEADAPGLAKLYDTAF